MRDAQSKHELEPFVQCQATVGKTSGTTANLANRSVACYRCINLWDSEMMNSRTG